MIGCSFSLPSYRRRRALYEPGVFEEVQTPALCDYTVQLRGGVAWRDCTVRLYVVAARRGYTVWSCCVAALCACGIVAPYRAGSVIHRGYPQCGELTRM